MVSWETSGLSDPGVQRTSARPSLTRHDPADNTVGAAAGVSTGSEVAVAWGTPAAGAAPQAVSTSSAARHEARELKAVSSFAITIPTSRWAQPSTCTDPPASSRNRQGYWSGSTSRGGYGRRIRL